MNFVRRMENFFEKHIEGYFNHKFSSELQPAEIAKKLVREMEAKHSVGVAKIYVPNHYEILLSKEDHQAFLPVEEVIRGDLASYLEEEAEYRGYTILGQPEFEFVAGTDLPKGEFTVTGEFTEAIPYEKKVQPAVEMSVAADLGQTRTFDRVMVSEREKPLTSAFLSVIEGPDIGQKVKITQQRFHLGRRESNELALSDMNTSRLHAYLQLEDGHYVLYDAKSLNGTYVNGEKINRRVLESGDKIKVGHTVLDYEVI